MDGRRRRPRLPNRRGRGRADGEREQRLHPIRRRGRRGVIGDGTADGGSTGGGAPNLRGHARRDANRRSGTGGRRSRAGRGDTPVRHREGETLRNRALDTSDVSIPNH
ncbi:hypothetical protein [Haladaptatus halobius]|uniref:hypothetical protein n=1 Tax=Haladaptatus halobius TaxID=2884875 RepID=UPI001D0BC0D2|nr:hypothetical protein [Haladaptatus halobius]